MEYNVLTIYMNIYTKRKRHLKNNTRKFRKKPILKFYLKGGFMDEEDPLENIYEFIKQEPTDEIQKQELIKYFCSETSHMTLKSDITKIIHKTSELCKSKSDGSSYEEKDQLKETQYAYDVALRVIADHVRASSFLIAEGVLPSSDGRGYVLRRLIRRACRHGRVLGLTSSFLFEVSKTLIELMGEAYPELLKEADLIQKTIKNEEEKFLQTFDSGSNILEKEINNLKKASKKVLSGAIAFQLHDTYGFPLDLTEDIVRAHGCSVDIDGFRKEMEIQKERSRSARQKQSSLILQKSVKPLKSQFVGYDYLEYESVIKGIFNESGEQNIAKEGEEIAITVEETPFYAESGGQVGDTGSISSSSGTLEVIDTQKAAGDTIVHLCRVNDVAFEIGTNVRLLVDEERRRKIRINHSATHILHYALREVLGSHIKQAGSRVGERNLRFDFTHNAPISKDELREIETIINRYISENHLVKTNVMPIDEAKKMGAVALFGEKYGSVVRVVEIGNKSLEFCGGTHTSQSGNIGLCLITSESSVSSGVRRIEGIAGADASNYVFNLKDTLISLKETLQGNENELSEKISKLIERNKELEKELGSSRQSSLSKKAESLTQIALKTPSGVSYISKHIESSSPEELRILADDLRNRLGSSCLCLASAIDGKAFILVACSKDITQNFHAGNIVKALASIVGAKGGGKPDLAQAGGGELDKLEDAFSKFNSILLGAS
jgi:alanyl-tRNA synthetase